MYKRNKDIDTWEVVVHPDRYEDANKLANKIRHKTNNYVIHIDKDMNNDTVLTIEFGSKGTCQDVIKKILDSGIRRDMYVHKYKLWSDDKWKK